MKVLMFCREGTGSRPYITEQVDALSRQGVEILCVYIRGSGIRAYINGLKELKKAIIYYEPNLVHAHYGLSGLFANLQRKVPVITTYHGSDINFIRVRPFSLIAAYLSSYNIFVSQKLSQKARARNKYTIQACGVSLNTFFPIEKQEARKKLNLKPDAKYILFSGSFNNKIKNVSLAKAAIKSLTEKAELIELNGYSREEVCLLFNACDVALMTSLMEGSPQFIKEAMACNCPVVSTNVGSTLEMFNDADGYFITTFEPKDVSKKLHLALNLSERTNGRSKIDFLDNSVVAENIIEIYKKVLKK